MAIKTKEELLESIRVFIGENNSDDAIAIIEDISDTLDDMMVKAKGDGKDWKTEYENNDKAWRKKYRDRFFNSSNEMKDEKEDIEEEEDKKSYSYEKLFKEE